jgi:hypothetical protein
MENAHTLHAFKETHNILSQIFEHAVAGGKAIEGDAIRFVEHSASNIESFVRVAGDEIIAAGHAAQLDHLTELFHRMYEMVEHNALLESFWEDMVQEIPDLIEWTENVLAKGGEAVAAAAETVGEVAVETAEVIGEAAIETAEVAGEASLEMADVIAAISTEV